MALLNDEKLRVLAVSLQRRLIVLAVRVFSYSITGISLVKSLLLPLDLLRNIRSWYWIMTHLKILRPEESRIQNLIRYHRARVDRIVWSALGHNAWDGTVKYHDFSRVDDLRIIASRGKGLLLLGMHYGPLFGGYVLTQGGLNPVILAAQANIPNLDRIPLKRLLTNEYIFRGTYDGIVAANHSERQFIKMMLAGRPGMIMMDGTAKRNVRATPCLGMNYPVGIFPFKLALRHAFPAVIMWFSKIRGSGYRLNIEEICFSSVEEGVAQYGALLDQVVRADPFLWDDEGYCAHIVPGGKRSPFSGRWLMGHKERVPPRE